MHLLTYFQTARSAFGGDRCSCIGKHLGKSRGEPVELQQLRYLVAASEAGSFSQAARDCFTSRQNIAHAVKCLEAEMETTLFERQGNNNVLTPCGKQAVRRARGILREVDELATYFKGGAHEEMVSFAVSTNLFAGMPFETEEYMTNISSHIRIEELACLECYKGVCSKDIDIALIMCMEQEFPGCCSYELASSAMYLLVNQDSPLIGMESIQVKDLLGIQLFVMSDPSFQYRNLKAAVIQRGGDEKAFRIIPSTSTALQMVRGGKGACLVSQHFADAPPHGLTPIPIDDPLICWHFYFLCSQGPSSNPLIEKILNSIKATFNGKSIIPFTK